MWFGDILNSKSNAIVMKFTHAFVDLRTSTQQAKLTLNDRMLQKQFPGFKNSGRFRFPNLTQKSETEI